MAGRIPPPNTAVLEIDRQGNFTGRIDASWYRYFVSLAKTADTAAAGEVQGGTGLSGGGPVSAGVTLSIANNGVGNAQLRQGAATSVIGRSANSAGNVADIAAGADHEVLTREGGTLAFRNTLDGVAIGGTVPAAVRCTTLRIDTAPAASTAVANQSVSVNINGATLYLLASTTP